MQIRLHFTLKTAAAALLACASGAHAQTLVTLDATTGTNSISTSYSTTGGLTLNMGFFVDYLIVGGGGGGGNGGGGGGGGGFQTGTAMQLNAASYNVTVGAGGGARDRKSTRLNSSH
jgi:hypothetical protein